jgi:hypothetical protein
LNQRAAALQRQLDAWVAQRPAAAQALAGSGLSQRPERIDWGGVLARAWQDFAYSRYLHSALRQLGPTDRVRLGELEKLIRQRHQLERQIASLDLVHRLMSVWRLVHVPLGAMLFASAFIHVIATVVFKGFHF